MKRIISILVAAMLLVSLCSVNAFAAVGTPEGEYTGTTGTADVKINIDGEVTHTYSVDIEYPALTFTYSAASKWDSDQHQYVPVDDSEATWSEAQTVKIINHSDLPVNYAVSATPVDQTYGPLKLLLNGSEATSIPETTIVKCEVGATYATAPSATFTVGVTGTPTVSQISGKVISTLTVAISKVSG